MDPWRRSREWLRLPGRLDSEPLRGRVELVELDDGALLVRPRVVVGGDHENVATVDGELGAVVHLGADAARHHVPDVVVLAPRRTHVAGEVPALRVRGALHLDVAEIDDLDLDSALLGGLVRLGERAAHRLAHRRHALLLSGSGAEARAYARADPAARTVQRTFRVPAPAPARRRGRGGAGARRPSPRSTRRSRRSRRR